MSDSGDHRAGRGSDSPKLPESSSLALIIIWRVLVATAAVAIMGFIWWWAWNHVPWQADNWLTVLYRNFALSMAASFATIVFSLLLCGADLSQDGSSSEKHDSFEDTEPRDGSSGATYTPSGYETEKFDPAEFPWGP